VTDVGRILSVNQEQTKLIQYYANSFEHLVHSADTFVEELGSVSNRAEDFSLASETHRLDAEKDNSASDA
jgi:hypothetical protein